MPQKRLLSKSEEFKKDILPQVNKQNVSKLVSELKRDLDGKSRSEAFRNLFRLPNAEILDGNVACALWAPYRKRYINGTIYISKNYICFASKVLKIDRMACFFFLKLQFFFQKISKELELVIPIRNIYLVEKPNGQSHSNKEEHDMKNSLIVTTKAKENFLFSAFTDRDYILKKISDMLLNNQEGSL
jgi:hypothetical protein